MTNGNGYSTTPIQEAGLPLRALHALEKTKGFNTMGDVIKAKDADLAAIKGLGRKSIDAIRRMIAERRLTGEAPAPPVKSPEATWAKDHEHVIRAIIAGEIELKVKGA